MEHVLTEAQVRSRARAMAKKTAKIATASSGQTIARIEATVVKVNGNGTLDANQGTSANPLPLESVPMLTSCSGAKAGDTVVIDVLGHIPLAIGIRA